MLVDAGNNLRHGALVGQGPEHPGGGVEAGVAGREDRGEDHRIHDRRGGRDPGPPEDEGEDSLADSIDSISDKVDDMQDTIDDAEVEDDIDIDIENNIDNHYIAECERCHGIFISSVVESDQQIEKIHGTCPLCDRDTDQYLKWTVKKVEK